MARLAFTLLLLIASEAFVCHASAPNEKGSAAIKPVPWNVLLVLADDLGWTDLACYGSDLHETPNLDRLAASGMRFTQSYSACTVCSPTRAALLTGKYPARLHITDWIPGAMPDNPKLLVPDWTKFLPHEETTLAEIFREAGYATASIGKWHLGEAEYYPESHGFDVNIAGTDKPQPTRFFAPYQIPTLREGPEGEYLTDRLADEAVRYLSKLPVDRPFFLYLPHFAVHTPIQGREDLVAKYRGKRRPEMRHRNPAYAAMVESLDSAVGKVLQHLESTGKDANTVVIFTSDNGGRITQGTTTNQPLRYGKASAYEGGVRVPLIVRWPGFVKPNSLCDAPVITMDLFPTLLEITGLNAMQPDVVDGVSLVPLLKQSGIPNREALFWHYPHHQHYQLGGTMPYGAIREGDYKLIEFYNDQRVELYNLREDLGEQQDLTDRLPEQTSRLREALHAWRARIGAQMPTSNPTHDPTKPEYNPKK